MELDEARIKANSHVLKFMMDLADVISQHFPHHAHGLRGELISTKLTETRWHRVSNLLGSLQALPGRYFTSKEHDSRMVAAYGSRIAKEMAYAMFGAKDPAATMNLAVWWADDVRNRMMNVEINTAKTKTDSSAAKQG